jgi:hypothetical protein
VRLHLVKCKISAGKGKCKSCIEKVQGVCMNIFKKYLSFKSLGFQRCQISGGRAQSVRRARETVKGEKG